MYTVENSQEYSLNIHLYSGFNLRSLKRN